MRTTINITNASRRIRNAWHFIHALIFVIKVVCGNTALRCSPLKRALCNSGKFRGSIFWDFSGHSFCVVGK
ncbi:hypothetical protein CCZ37_16395 [Vibrio qinghaiensis]|uniref:DUF3265 domain-containing protein n=1 Tax=Vibrio qinghaiensis TaxID=2025808 RepID=A0A223N375_9VIBR|nr:hypothetical protein CCZ37_16395 [Vibrio qinghaiensis]